MAATAERRRTLALQRKTRREGDCLIWTGSICPDRGYGQYRTQTTNLLVHRMVWEMAYGPVPPGHEIHHSCENRRCIELDHLQCLGKTEHRKLHARARRSDCPAWEGVE